MYVGIDYHKRYAVATSMDDKTLRILEFFKILERLANFCSFSASVEKAHALRPTLRGH